MKHTLLGNVINSSMYLQNILCYKWDTFSNMKPAIRFIYLRTIHYICKCLCRWKYIHKCVCTYNGPTCPMWHAKASSNPFILSPEQLVVLQDLKESLALLKVPFIQKVRFVFQISQSAKKIIPKNYPELEI